MRVIFDKPFDFVTLRAKNGRPRAMVSYSPDKEPQTVKRGHGEAAVEAGAAKEVREPAKRASGGVIKPGSYIIGERGSESVAPADKDKPE